MINLGVAMTSIGATMTNIGATNWFFATKRLNILKDFLRGKGCDGEGGKGIRWQKVLIL